MPENKQAYHKPFQDTLFMVVDCKELFFRRSRFSDSILNILYWFRTSCQSCCSLKTLWIKFVQVSNMTSRDWKSRYACAKTWSRKKYVKKKIVLPISKTAVCKGEMEICLPYTVEFGARYPKSGWTQSFHFRDSRLQTSTVTERSTAWKSSTWLTLPKRKS